MRFVRLLPLAVFSLLAACKQGDGDRCQVESDCESGLRCSDSQHICVPASSSDIVDGAPSEDSRFDARLADVATIVPDAGTPDAPPATVDAALAD